MEDDQDSSRRNEEIIRCPLVKSNTKTVKPTETNTMLCKDGFYRDPNNLESYVVDDTREAFRRYCKLIAEDALESYHSHYYYGDTDDK